MKYQITCINKENRYDIHSAITHIGGVVGSSGLIGGRAGLGTRFRITQEEAIARIKAGENFFVSNESGHVNVIVAISIYGNEYIKTESDGDEPNNLLSLPECQLGGGLLDYL